VRKRERKALLKSLQLAQISTASMGKFDKKVNKHEPDAPKSLKRPAKKSNQHLHDIEFKKSKGEGNTEKDRNLKILGMLQKEKEYNAGKKIGGPVQDDKKAMKNFKLKDEKQRAVMKGV